MSLRLAILGFGIVAPLLVLAQPQPPLQTATLPLAYVVLGEAGPVARVLMPTQVSCPSVELPGRALPMAPRQPPPGHGAAFAVTVCETVLPGDATGAQVLGHRLPLPPAAIHTIVGIGDTGCRLKHGHGGGSPAHIDHGDDKGKYQDCDQPAHWPFAQLAASAAKAGPDLVLHVGDYLYREAACPAGRAGCEGSPYGDNWLTWQADFFAPAAPLLKAAPWVAVRGNHEICARNGAGYMLFLDPRLAVDGVVAPCSDMLPTYTVRAGGRSFAVIDSSNADDLCDSAAACNSAAYVPAWAALAPTDNTWLVTHKPVWAVRRGPTIVTAALQASLQSSQPGGRLPPGISLALAGHIHFWQVLDFADGRPPQMVLGNGGTLMVHVPKGTLAGTPIAGTTVRSGRTHGTYGFTVFRSSGAGWRADFHRASGRKQFGCRIDGSRVAC